MSILVPDVPVATGVPTVLRTGLQIIDVPQVLLNEDAVANLANLLKDQWGIFDSDGNPLLTADAVISFDYRRDYRISDYPIENGDFQSYNKVKTPFEMRLTYSISGSIARRRAFFIACEALISSYQLVIVSCPEVDYKYANPVHWGKNRSQRGGTQMVNVDIFLNEVRVATTAQFAPNDPASADPVNNGNVGVAPPGAVYQESLPDLPGSSIGSDAQTSTNFPPPPG